MMQDWLSAAYQFFDTHVEWQVYLGLMIVITAMAYITRGLDAFRWSKSLMQSALANFVYLKLTLLCGGLFFILYYAISTGYEALGLPQLDRSFWDGMPFWAMALGLLFIYDFGLYWVHRVLHKPLLWPMHAVHHSDADLHFLSWSRGHPLEQAFIASCLLISSTWAGLSVEDVAILAIIRALHQHYVHANIDWDHGPLKYVLVSPRFHRWHHVDLPEAYDKNFASIFPFLDLMFGSYYNPEPSVDKPTGFEGGPGNDVIRLFTYPFTAWAAMFRNRDKALETAPETPGSVSV